MARQNGLLKISGTLANVNYYRVGEEYFSRKAGGGFSRKAIKEKQSMQKVRQFNDEFARCSAAKKAFRLALAPYIGDIKNRQLHSNLMKLFLELKNLDTMNEVGQRKISEGFKTEKGKQLINDFKFLPELDLSLEVVIVQPGNVAEFKIAAGNPKPLEARSYQVCCALLECDFDRAEFILHEPVSMTASSLPLSFTTNLQETGNDFLWVLEFTGFRRRLGENRVEAV